MVDVIALNNRGSWLLILLPTFTARKSPLTCAINKTQILIAGGIGSDSKRLADMIIYEPYSHNRETSILSASFKFRSVGNAFAVRPGTVLGCI